MNGNQADGPSVWRVLFCLPLALIGGAELALRMDFARTSLPFVSTALDVYLRARQYAAAHWAWLLPLTIATAVAVALLARALILWWHNIVVARLSGADLGTPPGATFEKKRFEPLDYLAATPDGQYFLGLDPRGKPVYLTEWDLDTHGHIMGHTGSGKTKSVLEPLMLQDMLHGKGVLSMDAKGSAENVRMMKGLAAVAGRPADVRVFALAYPAWSHTYNPVFLSPKADPLAMAERVFSVFPMAHEYYRGQSKLFFYNLMRLAAETGKAFNLVDLRLCVSDDDVLHRVYELSSDRRAKYEIDKQLAQLGRARQETFTGLYNALADYDHPLLNSYNPDIVIEDAVEQRLITYFNLPANLFTLLAPAIGKIVLQHIKAVGAMRQVDREGHDQRPFAVNIDELNRFAFPELVPSLAMLRDARIQFRLSHQSLGDLEQVSDVFTRQVKDNTRWKVFLFENDADHLEKVSRSYGTRTTFKKTVRFSLGPLLTFLNTGEVSSRETEEFIVHPNSLKSLAPQGQGYLLLPNRMTGCNFEILPRFAEVPDYPLPKKRSRGNGLGLYDEFVAPAEPDAGGASEADAGRHETTTNGSLASATQKEICA